MKVEGEEGKGVLGVCGGVEMGSERIREGVDWMSCQALDIANHTFKKKININIGS